MDVHITEPALLIRINRMFDPNMSDLALLEATRGQWRVGPRREEASLALAVYKGEVKEVYTISSWHPAGTLEYRTRTFDPGPDRWEFDGQRADDEVRSKYLHGDVRHYFKYGNAHPVVYVNCP
ncbi:hypothetical protein DVS28_a0256 [Euzebya pacifica]|uniref:Uncharacterized protein n=1 Tax=Euzebya pacifica TaxID=1608957 RepID=A0A346XRW6_9ACTN|nr:hypothetical protein [Euzebya pacifica]AXV04963.1 hypothetical protein DVS28_a0256 [Euzebya pacifica]